MCESFLTIASLQFLKKYQRIVCEVVPVIVPHLSADSFVSVLSGLLGNQVTGLPVSIHKMIIHILSNNRSKRAQEYLQQIWKSASHAHVRAVFIAYAASSLSDDNSQFSWSVLQSAVKKADVSVFC